MENRLKILEIMVPVAQSSEDITKNGNTHVEKPGRKRIGLFWNRKPNGDVLLNRLGELLKGKHPDMEIVWLKGKSDPAREAPVEALNEASQKCDLVILAVGD